MDEESGGILGINMLGVRNADTADGLVFIAGGDRGKYLSRAEVRIRQHWICQEWLALQGCADFHEYFGKAQKNRIPRGAWTDLAKRFGRTPGNIRIIIKVALRMERTRYLMQPKDWWDTEHHRY